MKSTGSAILALTYTDDEITGERTPIFSFPVQVVAGASSSDVKLEIRTPDGNVREQVYRDGVTHNIYSDGECPRGVINDDGNFVEIPAGSIDAIKEQTKFETMFVEGQMSLHEFWPLYGERVTGFNFLQVPKKNGSLKAYKIAYEALMAEEKVLLTKYASRGKQHAAAIYAHPNHEVLVMAIFRFAADLKQTDDEIQTFHKAEVPDAQIAMAREVINAMNSGAETMETLTDEAIPLKQDLIDKARGGEEIVAPEGTVQTTKDEDDIGALLMQSIGAVKAGKKAAKVAA